MTVALAGLINVVNCAVRATDGTVVHMHCQSSFIIHLSCAFGAGGIPAGLFRLGDGGTHWDQLEMDLRKLESGFFLNKVRITL